MCLIIIYYGKSKVKQILLQLQQYCDIIQYIVYFHQIIIYI